jgi:hypothetical protein
MRTIITALLLTLSIAGTGSAMASDKPMSHTPLRGADCIDTARINDWKIVDERTAIVRMGPKHYLVALKSSCPQLSHPPGLIFNTRSTAGADQGRICGGIGETVHSRGQPACAIESVSMIDKTKYNQLSDDAKRYMDGKAH